MSVSVEAVDWIAYHARVRPDSPACVDLASGRRRTYSEFNDRIARLAGYLRNVLGLLPEDRVLVLSKNDIDVFEIQFACRRAGLIFVPVNWRLAADEIAFIAEDCSAAAILLGREFAAPAGARREDGQPPHVLDLNQGGDSAFERAIAASEPMSGPISRSEGDCWSLIYTSGTTGRPKGAMISYRMALYNALELCAAFDVNASSVNLVALPTFHTGGLNVFANPVFFRGGTNIVLRDFEPGAAVEFLCDPTIGVTHYLAVPTMHAMLAREPTFGALANAAVRGVAAAGAGCPLPVLACYRDAGLDIRQCWGMTEAGPLGLLTPPDSPRRKLGSSGLPGMFMNVDIRDQEGRSVEDGHIGELVVKGASVTTGYWNRPEASAEAFTEDGWFRTGDAASRDGDGYHYIVDRWKDMYISGGENIYPAEIERVLHQLGGIRECAVVGVPDPKWGEVGCVFVVRADQRLGEADVLRHCECSLARYKLPKHVRFLDVLPRNASGKVLKHKLRDGLSRTGEADSLLSRKEVSP